MDPGLIYGDLDVRDYAGFICHKYAKDGDDDYALQDVIRDLSLNCSSLPKVMDFNLNYPSIMVPANTTVQRTLTNVGPAGNWYATVAITDGSGVEVDISPHILSFSQPGEKLTFNISTEARCLLATEGVLIWDTAYSKRRIQSPIARSWQLRSMFTTELLQNVNL